MNELKFYIFFTVSFYNNIFCPVTKLLFFHYRILCYIIYKNQIRGFSKKGLIKFHLINVWIIKVSSRYEFE